MMRKWGEIDGTVMDYGKMRGALSIAHNYTHLTMENDETIWWIRKPWATKGC
jgi:hypothetical protein